MQHYSGIVPYSPHPELTSYERVTLFWEGRRSGFRGGGLLSIREFLLARPPDFDSHEADLTPSDSAVIQRHVIGVECEHE